MAGLADCATLKLPAYARPLCPTPHEQAMGADWLDHQVISPLRTYEAPPAVTVPRGTIIAHFNHAVLVQQPLRVVGADLRRRDQAVRRDPVDQPR